VLNFNLPVYKGILVTTVPFYVKLFFPCKNWLHPECGFEKKYAPSITGKCLLYETIFIGNGHGYGIIVAAYLKIILWKT
jgi:hypothetical protein